MTLNGDVRSIMKISMIIDKVKFFMANPDDEIRGGMVFKKPEVFGPKSSILEGVRITKPAEIAVIGLNQAQDNAFRTHDAVWGYLQKVAQG